MIAFNQNTVVWKNSKTVMQYNKLIFNQVDICFPL